MKSKSISMLHLLKKGDTRVADWLIGIEKKIAKG